MITKLGEEKEYKIDVNGATFYVTYHSDDNISLLRKTKGGYEALGVYSIHEIITIGKLFNKIEKVYDVENYNCAVDIN